MRNYFTTLKLIAEKAKGQKPVFILEPDTWGYALAAELDSATAKAVVNNLGASSPSCESAQHLFRAGPRHDPRGEAFRPGRVRGRAHVH